MSRDGMAPGVVGLIKKQTSDFTIFFLGPHLYSVEKLSNTHFDGRIFQMGLKPPTSI